jgi:hypothetical protein
VPRLLDTLLGGSLRIIAVTVISGAMRSGVMELCTNLAITKERNLHIDLPVVAENHDIEWEEVQHLVYYTTINNIRNMENISKKFPPSLDIASMQSFCSIVWLIIIGNRAVNYLNNDEYH